MPKAMEAITCTADAARRFLTSLFMFSEVESTAVGVVAGGPAGGVTMAPNAQVTKAAAVERGTPVMLLLFLYHDFGVRLAVYNGSPCRYAHVPNNWESTPDTQAQSHCFGCVGNHVSTYGSVARNPKVDKPYLAKARVQALMEVGVGFCPPTKARRDWIGAL